MRYKIYIIPLLLLLFNNGHLHSQETKGFEQAYNELTNMLEGKQIASFEKAVFLAENPYLSNKYSFKDFQFGINQHLYLINKLIKANDRSDSIDFRVIIDPHKPYNIRKLRYTSSEKKELYRKALTNWAIFTYMTDTIELPYSYHMPFSYQINDPFGINDWTNSQVINLLTKHEQKGNCLALVSLFKIFSERLNSNAIICTAPGHIYLRHKNEKGEVYNVELATGSHPGDGSIRTLTYTNREALMSDIALRQLDSTQNIALCLVNLGKSYERKFNTKSNDFILKCAETALTYDSLSLNAHLLKLQVLEDRTINHALKHQLSFEDLKQNKVIAETYNQLEQELILLYNLGYRQMPLDMQEMVLAGLQKKDNDKPILVEDKTPNPFTSIQPKDKSDTRYSTLSGGIYPEVHEKKPIEIYGRLAFDTQKKQIIEYDTNKINGLLIDPVAFAWSIDPHASSYPSFSPYSAMGNNPNYYLDPDGRDIIGWLKLKGNKNYGRAAKIHSQSSVFVNLLEHYQDYQGGDRITPYGTGQRRYSGALSDVQLSFQMNNNISGRGQTSISWDSSIDAKDLTLSDFNINVEFKVLEGDLRQGETIMVMSHETGLHLASYTELLVKFKQGEISGEELIEQLKQVESSDHHKIEGNEHQTFNDLNKEIDKLVGQSRTSLSTGIPGELRKDDFWLAPGSPAFDFSLKYRIKGIDLNPNKYGVTTPFQSTKGGRVSLYNNYRYHRSEHDFDYSSENEDNLIGN